MYYMAINSSANDKIMKALSKSRTHLDRQAVESWFVGQDYHQPCFAIGLGAGNPIGSLISNGGILYHVKRLHEYRYELEPIAKALI